jgi:hypothetical protein
MLPINELRKQLNLMEQHYSEGLRMVRGLQLQLADPTPAYDSNAPRGLSAEERAKVAEKAEKKFKKIAAVSKTAANR